MREFVKLDIKQEEEREKAIAAGEIWGDQVEELPLPSIPYVSLPPRGRSLIDDFATVEVSTNHDQTRLFGRYVTLLIFTYWKLTMFSRLGPS